MSFLLVLLVASASSSTPREHHLPRLRDSGVAFSSSAHSPDKEENFYWVEVVRQQQEVDEAEEGSRYVYYT